MPDGTSARSAATSVIMSSWPLSACLFWSTSSSPSWRASSSRPKRTSTSLLSLYVQIGRRNHHSARPKCAHHRHQCYRHNHRRVYLNYGCYDCCAVLLSMAPAHAACMICRSSTYGNYKLCQFGTTTDDQCALYCFESSSDKTRAVCIVVESNTKHIVNFYHCRIKRAHKAI